MLQPKQAVEIAAIASNADDVDVAVAVGIGGEECAEATAFAAEDVVPNPSARTRAGALQPGDSTGGGPDVNLLGLDFSVFLAWP